MNIDSKKPKINKLWKETFRETKINVENSYYELLLSSVMVVMVGKKGSLGKKLSIWPFWTIFVWTPLDLTQYSNYDMRLLKKGYSTFEHLILKRDTFEHKNDNNVWALFIE